MTDEPTDAGWFRGVDPGDPEAAREAIEHGRADEPADWPGRAVEAGFADDESDYYDALHGATVHATREAVRERERADDQQLIHCVRAMDDCERTANELAERATEWAGALLDVDAASVEDVRTLADREAADPTERRLLELCRRVRDLDEEAAALRAFVEERAPGVAPNLAAMAGPVLAARLIALAGGLGELARKPSGTVQVLGAEDALFAHLRGEGPSPKHGVIFTHEYVRGTDPGERGSAARALAGKLTIAARVDHYSGERRPELDAELDERIRRIRTRVRTDGGARSSRTCPAGPNAGWDGVTLPEGVERRTIDGERGLATRGPPAYGEATDGGWRRWDPHRSKLAAMLELGMETGLPGGDRVLYLGAAAGTTTGHVADFAGPTYAVEFAPRPARDLVAVAEDRPNLFPLLKDAREPETYAHVVEADLDAVVQDVATRGQARVARLNRRFLGPDGRLVAALKARSEDVAREPSAVFEELLADLRAEFEVLATERLEPYHDAHLGVVATPR